MNLDGHADTFQLKLTDGGQTEPRVACSIAPYLSAHKHSSEVTARLRSHPSTQTRIYKVTGKEAAHTRWFLCYSDMSQRQK